MAAENYNNLINVYLQFAKSRQSCRQLAWDRELKQIFL